MVLDLSQYTEAEAAAKAFAAFLRDYAEKVGQKRSEIVFLYPPEHRDRFGNSAAFHVMWEGGPFEWAIALMGGESLGSAEFPELRLTSNEPEVTGFTGENWSSDPYYSFSVAFYPH